MQNSKMHAKWYHIPFALMFLFLVSCKKGDIQNDNSAKFINYSDPLISSAESFFYKEISGNNTQPTGSTAWQKRKKTPLWDNAYIAKYPKNDIVVVPLKFQKGLSIKSSISGDSGMSLEEQSKLILYKDSSGKFHAEVYTYIPTLEYLKNKTSKYSGIVIKEDWACNKSNKYLFKNGKYVELTESVNQSQLTTESVDCYYLNLYECDVASDGSLYNCELFGSYPLGCYGSFGEETLWIDPSSGDGGGGVTYYPIAEYATTTELDWEFYRANAGSSSFIRVGYFIQLWGKKNSTYPQGGYFTAATSHGGYTQNFSDYGMDYQEVSDQASYGTQNAYHAVQGNIIFPPNTQDPTYVNKTKTFLFAEVFP